MGVTAQTDPKTNPFLAVRLKNLGDCAIFAQTLDEAAGHSGRIAAVQAWQEWRVPELPHLREK